MTVRTRFAPSPTGYLHIGGVRTALFCWLFARQHGGQFILRIDDTDQQRNVEAALEPILRGLRWLGIDWDEGPEVGGPHAPYYQSQRADRHRAAVVELLRRGKAYYDYATTDEIQAERAAAEKAGQQFVYSRRFMAQSDDDRARFEAEGRKPAVRLLMPREGTLVLEDLVRGRVEFEWAREQDHVIQRADGSCLYHLASVVDDRDFEITHVIRAEEHLSNTPRQAFIAQSLDWPLPHYAHLPFVAEPGSRNKLSKRKLDKYLKHKDFAEMAAHGERILRAIGAATGPDAVALNPVMVDFYEAVGYLPAAIINYLALLGWSLDDKTEHFSRERLIAAFSLERVNKAPASFDAKKLRAFQERHMQAVPIADKAAMVRPFVERAGLTAAADELTALVAAAGDRIKVAGDILEFADFLTPDAELPYDAKALEQTLRKPGAAELVAACRAELAVAEPFEPAALEKLVYDFAAGQGVKIGQIIHPLRVALTGKSVGLGLFDTLAILGRPRALARMDRALAAVSKSG
jgi:glutamyl-tRNA synthetase